MKTIDFIDFMDFSQSKRGRGQGIQENQCSVLINAKNNAYYFRFAGQKFKYLKVGKMNGKLCFVLNNKDGVRGTQHTSGGTTAYNGKEMVFTLMKIIHNEFNQKNFKATLNFDIIDNTVEHQVFVFKNIEIY